MMKIQELFYSRSRNYLIVGERGVLLFDTGWAGSFPEFCRALKKTGVALHDIDYLMISHFHPDHCGIAQEIVDHADAELVAFETQRNFLHQADGVFEKESKVSFVPIMDERVRFLSFGESRELLLTLGIEGEVISTPGHSADSISLCLDEGSFFVGDLNPLYELELHQGTEIAESWERLLAKKPKRIYYGHAKMAELDAEDGDDKDDVGTKGDRYRKVEKVVRLLDRDWTFEKIQRKTGVGMTEIEDIARMYLTHQNIGVQGILDRIEIKGK